MRIHSVTTLVLAVWLPSALAHAQQSVGEFSGRWRAPDGRTASQGDDDYGPPVTNAVDREPVTRVTKGDGVLPNDQGQVWREYDVTPYTVRVTSTNRPEQAIVDWILRETGYETWHSETAALLSADRRTLRVYHTPEVQAVVADVVDRFVSSQAESHAFSVRVVTVGHPNWRVKAQSMLRAVPVQTQGVQAWLVERENASLLLAELRKRLDFREHSSPHLLVNNGQAATVSASRPRNYVQDIVLRPDAWPAFEPRLTQFDEGFSFELSPLLSLDGQLIDGVIKCNIDQVEKLVPVTLDVPSPVAPHQRTRVEVPQITHFRLHERFRWPVDQVLVVGLGVVATPVPAEPAGLNLKLPLVSSPPRADLLVFIESKGRVGSNDGVTPIADQSGGSRGRY